MDELAKTARIVRWNRFILAGVWGLFGCACLVRVVEFFVRRPAFISAHPGGDPRASIVTAVLVGVPLVVGVLFLASAWGFYRGTRWGRIGIGILMAFLALYCFDRLVTLVFGRIFNWFFAVVCFLLAAAFYTWLFLFSGLDRGGPLPSDGDFERQLGPSE